MMKTWILNWAERFGHRLAASVRAFRIRNNEAHVAHLGARIRITISQLSPEDREPFVTFLREEYAENPIMREAVERAAGPYR